MSSSVFVRLDDNLKKEASDVLNKMGLDISTAIKMFLRQVVNKQAIPFEISVSNSKETNDLSNLKTNKLFLNEKDYQNFINSLNEPNSRSAELLKMLKEADEIKARGI